MQAVRNKLSTLKAKLDEAEKAAQAAQDELDDCNKQADGAEEKVNMATLLNFQYLMLCPRMFFLSPLLLFFHRGFINHDRSL